MEDSKYQIFFERMIPESQLREAVREILAEMLGMHKQKEQTARQWYPTDPAYRLLGLDSAEQLRIMVRSDLLRVGVEVRDIRETLSPKPHYQFHIQKCEERLNTLPEKRSTTKNSKKAS